MRSIILYQDEDGFWIVECPSLPGCFSQGESRDEAVQNIKEAIEVWIEDAKLRNEPIPDDTVIELLQV